jgi:hypothetical protein
LGPAWHSRRPHQRHCGTGIWPDRDIATGCCGIEIPCASLPTSPPQQPRSPARKAGVLHVRERLGARDRLSAGGRWIRTLGSAARRDRPFRDHLGPPRASLPPREATYLARGTWGLNPVCSSGASSKPRRQRLETSGVYDALAWNADVAWPEQPLGASRLRYTCPMCSRVPPSSDVSEIKGCLLEQRRPRPANNPRQSLSRGYRYSPIR